MKKALVLFIILFISCNCLGTEKEIADVVRSTEILLPPLTDIVVGYAAGINSSEWFDVLNKLNTIASKTSNLRNKAIQALVGLILGNINFHDPLLASLETAGTAGCWRCGPPPYSKEIKDDLIKRINSKPVTDALQIEFLRNAKSFQEIVFYFQWFNHKFPAHEILNIAINQLEILRKLAATNYGVENLLRLYDLTHERFCGNNWNEAWILNPEKLRKRMQDEAIFQSNEESAACQNQDNADRASKKRKEPDERADDSTESKKRKIDDEQSQEL